MTVLFMYATLGRCLFFFLLLRSDLNVAMLSKRVYDMMGTQVSMMATALTALLRTLLRKMLDTQNI